MQNDINKTKNEEWYLTETGEEQFFSHQAVIPSLLSGLGGAVVASSVGMSASPAIGFLTGLVVFCMAKRERLLPYVKSATHTAQKTATIIQQTPLVQKYTNTERSTPKLTLPSVVTQTTQESPLSINTRCLLGTSTETGEDVFIDFNKEYHIAITGGTGCGKDNTIRSLVLQLMRQNTPESIQFAILDGKGDWLLPYMASLSHMFFPPKGGLVKEGVDALEKGLAEVMQEMARRHTIFRQAGCRTHKAFNEQGGREPLIVVVLSDVMTYLNTPEIELNLTELVAKGRSLGFRVIVSMQTLTRQKTAWRTNILTSLSGYQHNDSQNKPNQGTVGRLRASDLTADDKGIFHYKGSYGETYVQVPLLTEAEFDQSVKNIEANYRNNQAVSTKMTTVSTKNSVVSGQNSIVSGNDFIVSQKVLNMRNGPAQSQKLSLSINPENVQNTLFTGETALLETNRETETETETETNEDKKSLYNPNLKEDRAAIAQGVLNDKQLHHIVFMTGLGIAPSAIVKTLPGYDKFKYKEIKKLVDAVLERWQEN